MVTDLHILKRARDLLKAGWAKEWFAYDDEGKEAGVGSPKACNFCATGALYRALGELRGNWETTTQDIQPLVQLLGFDGASDVEGFNDEQTGEEPVIARFDEAIARLEATV